MVVAPGRSLGLKGKIKNGGEVEDRGFGAVCVCLFNKLWFCFFFSFFCFALIFSQFFSMCDCSCVDCIVLLFCFAQVLLFVPPCSSFRIQQVI